MRVVVQRVSRAEVRIAGRSAGKINQGLLLLVGFKADDTEASLLWMAEKVVGLRIFNDDDEKMNRSLVDIGGGLLVVSQFTLYGDASKGRRPSFIDAAPPPIAIPLYERFVALLRGRAPGPVETGEFGAMMDDRTRKRWTRHTAPRALMESVPPIVLASQSPRREQLLRMLGLQFEVAPADVDETYRRGENAKAHAERLSREKAMKVSSNRPDALVIGSDTVVVLDRKVLGKPRDPGEAIEMLMRLQGRTHRVETGIAIATPDQLVLSGIETVRVHFRPFDRTMAEEYVATNEPLDKAGAYGIQGFGAAIVERIEGDFFAVMGLPIGRMLALLRAAGWRYNFQRLERAP